MSAIKDLSIGGIFTTLTRDRNVQNKNRSIEKYDMYDGYDRSSDFSLFIILLALVAFWVWALYLLVVNFRLIPDWAKIIGILGLTLNNISGGFLLTLFVVYIGKYMQENKM